MILVTGRLSRFSELKRHNAKDVRYDTTYRGLSRRGLWRYDSAIVENENAIFTLKQITISTGHSKK